MSLGSRIKVYETCETSHRFIPMLPIYARIDGRSFSKFTKNMAKPFDPVMSKIMQDVTAYLVKETNAKIGYTQSDEISLVWQQDKFESEVFFAGKKQKMISVLSALATAKFVQLALQFYPDECKKTLPVFDCRVFQLPSPEEAVNCFVWRNQDAIRNSVQMAGRAIFSHRELDHKNQSNIIDMLFDVGVVWADYPKYFKEGTFWKRTTFEKTPGVIRSIVAEVIPDIKFEDLSFEEKIQLIMG